MNKLLFWAALIASTSATGGPTYRCADDKHPGEVVHTNIKPCEQLGLKPIDELPPIPAPVMHGGYYGNARWVCQIHASAKAGRKFPDFLPQVKPLSVIAKVEPVNNSRNLLVTA